MAIVHIAVLSAALSALLVLPCAAAVITGEARDLRRLLLGRRAGAHHGRRERRALRRLDHALQRRDPVFRSGPFDGPSIEQLAFDLRRLGRQRRSGPTRCSQRWTAAVERAYDLRLQMACRRLGVPERLEPLRGADRDRERMRVEGRLEDAGLLLRHEAGR